MVNERTQLEEIYRNDFITLLNALEEKEKYCRVIKKIEIASSFKDYTMHELTKESADKVRETAGLIFGLFPDFDKADEDGIINTRDNLKKVKAESEAWVHTYQKISDRMYDDVIDDIGMLFSDDKDVLNNYSIPDRLKECLENEKEDFYTRSSRRQFFLSRLKDRNEPAEDPSTLEADFFITYDAVLECLRNQD